MPIPAGPPATRAASDLDVSHGHRVADPYRWLESPDSPETVAWVDSQNAVTFDYQGFSLPVSRKGRLFYFRNDGLQNQSPFYLQESPDRPARLLLDPNLLSSDGFVALPVTVPSPDEQLLLSGTSVSGSD